MLSGRAGAAVGVDGDGVGEDADDVGVDGLEAVDAGEDLGAGAGRDEGGVVAEIGAHPSDVAGAHGEEGAVLVEGELALGDVVAAVGVGEEGLAALAGPLHGAAELAGGVADHGVLGVEEELHAEAAADVGGDDADAVEGRLEDDGGQHLLDAPAALGVGGQRPLGGGRVVGGGGGAGLHAVDDDAVVHDRQAGDVRGLGEEGVDAGLVAGFPVEADVLRHVRPRRGG